MDDRVHALASAEAGRIRKFRDAEEEEGDRRDLGLPAVPLLHVSRSFSGSWTVSSSGEHGHPNEPRMPFIRDWIARDVLLPSTEGDPTGTYRLQLHDACSYLPRGADFQNVLSFGRTPGACVAMFPDPYQASGYLGEEAVIDDVPWEAKRPTVVFAGSTTGHTDPDKNARVLACLWALDHPRETDFRISAVVQMCPYDVRGQVHAVIAPHLPAQLIFRHRFVANIVGNSACWSRVPMVMGSRSVLFHVPHDDMVWYTPAMQAGVHYVECPTLDSILSCRRSCLADDAGCRHMTLQANDFQRRLLTRGAAVEYAVRLLCDIRGK